MTNLTEREREAVEHFAKWFAREVPPNTIISDPHWWAPRIMRAARAALSRVPPMGEEGGDAVALRDAARDAATLFDRLYRFLHAEWVALDQRKDEGSHALDVFNFREDCYYARRRLLVALHPAPNPPSEPAGTETRHVETSSGKGSAECTRSRSATEGSSVRDPRDSERSGSSTGRGHDVTPTALTGTEGGEAERRDIVRRLRQLGDADINDEAADLIERLTRERDQARGEVRDLRLMIGRDNERAERQEATNADLADALNSAERSLSEALAVLMRFKSSVIEGLAALAKLGCHDRAEDTMGVELIDRDRVMEIVIRIRQAYDLARIDAVMGK